MLAAKNASRTATAEMPNTGGGPMAYRQDLPASLALSPEQQAEVAALVEAAGLDASEFMWAVQPNSYHLIGPLVSALVHTPTGYSFRFEFLESALARFTDATRTKEAYFQYQRTKKLCSL